MPSGGATCANGTISGTPTTVIAAPASGFVNVLHSSTGYSYELANGSNIYLWNVSPAATNTTLLDGQVVAGSVTLVGIGGGPWGGYSVCYDVQALPSSTAASDALTSSTGALGVLGPGVVQMAGGLLILVVISVMTMWVLRRIRGG